MIVALFAGSCSTNSIPVGTYVSDKYDLKVVFKDDGWVELFLWRNFNSSVPYNIPIAHYHYEKNNNPKYGQQIVFQTTSNHARAEELYYAKWYFNGTNLFVVTQKGEEIVFTKE